MSEKRKRHDKVTVRLLPAEFFALQAAANLRDLSIPDYMRLTALGALPLHAPAPTFAALGVPTVEEWSPVRAPQPCDVRGDERCAWCEKRGLFIWRCTARADRVVLGESVCAQHDMKVRRMVAEFYDARAAGREARWARRSA